MDDIENPFGNDDLNLSNDDGDADDDLVIPGRDDDEEEDWVPPTKVRLSRRRRRFFKTPSNTTLFFFQDDASRLEFDEVDVESPVTSDTTGLISGSRKQTKASSEKKKEKKSSTCWCCSLDFAAQYFDVDTSDVKNRIQNVIMPCPSNKFLTITHGNPDFYGPFWIATTLIFVIGVTANINEYSSSEDKTWYVLFYISVS